MESALKDFPHVLEAVCHCLEEFTPIHVELLSQFGIGSFRALDGVSDTVTVLLQPLKVVSRWHL